MLLIIAGLPLDEVKAKLDRSDIRYHIDDDSNRNVGCITWTTDEQLDFIRRFPDVIMMRMITYKSEYSLVL